MLKENLIKNLKRAGLLLSLALGILVFTGVDAKAQYNRDDDDYYRNQRRERREEERRREERRRNNDDYYNRNGGYYGNNNGYYGNNNYNNVYRIAQENGYRDGYNKGMEEYREGDRYNPQNTSPYRNGLNGYNRYMGNREQYKQIYRQAFLQGFRQGYNQYGNRNRRWGY